MYLYDKLFVRHRSPTPLHRDRQLIPSQIDTELVRARSGLACFPHDWTDPLVPSGGTRVASV